MNYIPKEEEYKLSSWFEGAINEAIKSTCLRSKCGSVIIKNEKIIGRGFNSPPANLDSQRRCLNDKLLYDKNVTDKTCCIHAEQRAIVDALKNNPQEIKDSVLYFIRLDLENNILFSGKPYCTHCSKLALDVGIKKFVLWHEEGIGVYDTEGYNDLSFDYRK
jgi:deoxycytidylate deaminase